MSKTLFDLNKKKDINKTNLKAVIDLADNFESYAGRRPRIMIAQFGLNDERKDLKGIASAFADIGFDVDISPSIRNTSEAVQHLLDNDVHIVCINSFNDNYKSIVLKLKTELNKIERDDILIIITGTIPKQDITFLYKNGVSAIISLENNFLQTTQSLLEKLYKGL